ncbi:hypothetical protein DYY67_2087 [Candidatus Nitrosotalea sp. TS]|uniref:hypothetical protein n=1 Tax=Candidatus Nitrosotalea sp. TS TaxID=2341020 RepID=UPI00140E78D6|nr:hypothetical protein [Candidatus Nitrosotalea sp. TS]NHI04160.1 hypothetical protein [Candidatus Nitrosotalea sp. TS]
MEWRVWFEQPYDATQKISNTHYDIFTVDNQGQKTSSYAQSLGRQDMFAPVGSDDITFIDNQPPPVTHFVIYFAGLALNLG